MKIVTIIGARPQFIKAAVVSRKLKENNVSEILVHTGQHFDANMSEIFFQEMEIPKPLYNLKINGLGHGAMTGQMLEKIEEILLKENPDWVLVYGDTNSTLAGALAAKKLQIKVAHVEAGLRSFNISMPEEVNRILTDRISNILFCPTDTAVRNLQNEGYGGGDTEIYKVGDVMQDAALFYKNRAKAPKGDLPPKFVLSTVHRAENTNNSEVLVDIFRCLEEISREIPVVMPLHPRTKNRLTEIGYDFESSEIKFIKPVSYLEMIFLLKNCELVMSDSGGLQKEAYFFNKYCITLREETEWEELVSNGFNFICGSDSVKIKKTFQFIKNNPISHFNIDLYGEGDAGGSIIKSLIRDNN